MTKVKFEDIKIYKKHNGGEERCFCCADMVVNNRRIPVQLQKLNTGEWVAIGLESQTLHLLSTNKKDSFEDWFDDSEANVCGVVSRPE